MMLVLCQQWRMVFILCCEGNLGPGRVVFCVCVCVCVLVCIATALLFFVHILIMSCIWVLNIMYDL